VAKQDTTPDSLAKKTFLITIVGAVLYITVVFAFVIGGNRREEAQEREQAAGQQPSAEHQP
jgi:hypothetical protein